MSDYEPLKRPLSSVNLDRETSARKLDSRRTAYAPPSKIKIETCYEDRVSDYSHGELSQGRDTVFDKFNKSLLKGDPWIGGAYQNNSNNLSHLSSKRHVQTAGNSSRQKKLRVRQKA